MIQLFTIAAHPPFPIMNRSIAANLCPGEVTFGLFTRATTKICVARNGFI